MKKLILISALLLFASNGWAETYEECESKADQKFSSIENYDEYVEKICRPLDFLNKEFSTNKESNKSQPKVTKKSPMQPQKNLPKEWE